LVPANPQKGIEMNRILQALLLLATSTAALAASIETQTLGVREGVAEQMSPSKLHERYKGFAEFITRTMGKPTLVDASQEAKLILANMKSGKYAVMFVRPVGLAGRAIRENNFTLVAQATDELYAAVIVPKDSPLKRIEDLVGKRVTMPEQSAFITKVGLAALRDAGVDPSKININYTRFQDSAAYTVDAKLADAAIVSSVIAKQWEKKGHRVLYRSKHVPSWAVIASNKVTAGEVTKLRQALFTLDGTDQGRKVLQQIGVSGFKQGDPEEYLAMLKWIRV